MTHLTFFDEYRWCHSCSKPTDTRNLYHIVFVILFLMHLSDLAFHLNISFLNIIFSLQKWEVIRSSCFWTLPYLTQLAYFFLIYCSISSTLTKGYFLRRHTSRVIWQNILICCSIRPYHSLIFLRTYCETFCPYTIWVSVNRTSEGTVFMVVETDEMFCCCSKQYILRGFLLERMCYWWRYQGRI